MKPTDDVDIYDMTKAELLAFAEDNSINGVDSSMLKADILAVIEGAIA